MSDNEKSDRAVAALAYAWMQHKPEPYCPVRKPAPMRMARLITDYGLDVYVPTRNGKIAMTTAQSDSLIGHLKQRAEEICQKDFDV